MQLRYYTDNEGQVRIAITDPQPDVERLVRAIDATDEDRALVEKLMAMDAQWAAQSNPREDAMGLADRLHEVTRDADLEIRRLRHRCNALIGGGLCIASGCLAVGILIGGLL